MPGPLVCYAQPVARRARVPSLVLTISGRWCWWQQEKFWSSRGLLLLPISYQKACLRLSPLSPGFGCIYYLSLIRTQSINQAPPSHWPGRHRDLPIWHIDQWTRGPGCLIMPPSKHHSKGQGTQWNYLIVSPIYLIPYRCSADKVITSHLQGQGKVSH